MSSVCACSSRCHFQDDVRFSLLFVAAFFLFAQVVETASRQAEQPEMRIRVPSKPFLLDADWPAVIARLGCTRTIA